LTATPTDIPILRQIGRAQPIASVLMRSRTTQPNGATKTTTDSEAIPKETTPMIAPPLLAHPPKTGLAVLTEMVTVIPMQATPSQTIRTQWSDRDGDNRGDNQSGNNPDAFPDDTSQWKDTDGDGYGDNPGGNNGDSFPSDGTQWSDEDNDGYGDNTDGNDGDFAS
jgi:hypothetical protein